MTAKSRALATRGRAFAKARYSWEASTDRLAEIIESLAHQRILAQPLTISADSGLHVTTNGKTKAGPP